MIKLRNYQQSGIDMIRNEIRAGHNRVLLVMPTGSGKTPTLGIITKKTVDNGHKVIALMHRRQLVTQMLDRFEDCGVKSGAIMSGFKSSLENMSQVCTMQTYLRRLKTATIKENKWYIDAKVIMVDEAHHILSKTYQTILKNYNDKIVIGVTATPCLASGVGLGDYFNAIVQPISVQELIDQGHLVPAVYFGPTGPDLSKLNTVCGDYEKTGLNKVMNQPKIVGSAVENWLRIAPDKKTMVFAVKVDHSKALRDEFLKQGVPAEHLDAHSPDQEREEVLNRFRSGETQVLINVGLYTEGSDIPEIECIVVARPTKSLGLHLQILGRGARPHPGKENFIVIDHGGNVARLGYYEDEIEWGLSGKQISAKNKINRKKEKKIRACAECMFMFSGAVCPRCGAKVVGYAKEIAMAEAELKNITKGKKKKKVFTAEEKSLFLSNLEYEKRRLDKKEYWSGYNYKKKFGELPPPGKEVIPIKPDQGFKNWMQYMRIRFFKSKAYLNKKKT